ncbi:MAG: hypothetical protein ABEJ56_05590 [Candidatus Nanohaloarchaea archaeon]
MVRDKIGREKFYTVPFKSAQGARGYAGIIVPASSKDSAKRTAQIHTQNMMPEPPQLKRSAAHVSTAKEIDNSEMTGGGAARQQYVVADERIE